MHRGVYIAIILVLVLLILHKSEHLQSEPDKSDKNYIRLYETFTFKPNPPDARWWEFSSSGRSYIKKDLKMYLKSYDIKVDRGNVQIWAIYPGETLASSSALGVSGFGDAYTDAMPLQTETGKDPILMLDNKYEYNPPGWQHTYTTNAMRANSSKYQLIAEAKSGDHIQGTLDFKATRVLVIASFY